MCASFCARCSSKHALEADVVLATALDAVGLRILAERDPGRELLGPGPRLFRAQHIGGLLQAAGAASALVLHDPGAQDLVVGAQAQPVAEARQLAVRNTGCGRACRAATSTPRRPWPSTLSSCAMRSAPACGGTAACSNVVMREVLRGTGGEAGRRFPAAVAGTVVPREIAS